MLFAENRIPLFRSTLYGSAGAAACCSGFFPDGVTALEMPLAAAYPALPTAPAAVLAALQVMEAAVAVADTAAQPWSAAAAMAAAAEIATCRNAIVHPRISRSTLGKRR